MNATEALPLQNLLDDTGPSAVLSLVGALAEAAMSSHVDIIHPADVVLAIGGRPGLQVAHDREPGETWAPEAERSGPTPGTLSFSLAMIGVIAALGSAEPAPEEDEEHEAWLRQLTSRLEIRWSGQPGASRAIELLARCLSRDPFARPRPHQLIEELGDPSRLPPAPPLLSEITAGTRSVRPITLSGVQPSSKPQSASFLWMASVVALLAMAVALCTLGALVGKWIAVDPAPTVVLQPPPEPVRSAPEQLPSPAQAAQATAEAPAQPSPAAPAPSLAPQRPRPTQQVPAPTEPAPPEAAPPEPAPPEPVRSKSDLRDPWK